MTLELRKRVFELLASRPEERFKAREIAKWICEQHPLEAAEKLQASASLTNQTQL
ncbi:hypothetical protein X726_04100 [Mesorhizobium sp. L103C105A0]|nr:hypothetical protein X726_04100 [Mesorhizobium sp. L103C105A0]